MSGVQRRLLRHSQPSRLTFIGEEKESGEFYAKMVSCRTGTDSRVKASWLFGTVGSSGVLFTWHTGTGSSQWTVKEVPTHCQEPNVHLLSDVQRDANWPESRDSAFQHGSRSHERHLC